MRPQTSRIFQSRPTSIFWIDGKGHGPSLDPCLTSVYPRTAPPSLPVSRPAVSELNFWGCHFAASPPLMIPNSSLSAVPAIHAVPFACWSWREIVRTIYLVTATSCGNPHTDDPRIPTPTVCLANLAPTQPWHSRTVLRICSVLWFSPLDYGPSSTSAYIGALLTYDILVLV